MTDDLRKLIEYRFQQAEEVITNARNFIAEAHKFLKTGGGHFSSGISLRYQSIVRLSPSSKSISA